MAPGLALEAAVESGPEKRALLSGMEPRHRRHGPQGQHPSAHWDAGDLRCASPASHGGSEPEGGTPGRWKHWRGFRPSDAFDQPYHDCKAVTDSYQRSMQHISHHACTYAIKAEPNMGGCLLPRGARRGCWPALQVALCLCGWTHRRDQRILLKI